MHDQVESSPVPAFVGQGTAIEQSRAVAEVQVAALLAEYRPRDEDRCLQVMLRACRGTALAERAFYKVPRGGKTATGPSIDLARELARCWGNIQYGVAELRRDDARLESEMQAYAWDVQTNTRSAHIFIVPHRRNVKGEMVPLTDLQGVYENNANQGARRVREAIFAVLPSWFAQEAITQCRRTLESPNDDAAAKAVTMFAAMRVDQARLEAKVGRPVAEWTDSDVAELRISYGALQRKEVTAAEEFPPRRVTTEEIDGA